MKPHPAFPPVGSSRGAPMGRPDILPDAPPASLHIKRATPTDGDYDQGGAYWGNLDRSPLFAVWGYTEAGDIFAIYIRASHRIAALCFAFRLVSGETCGTPFPRITARNPYNPTPKA